MNEGAVEGVAHAHAASLGIVDDACAFFKVAVLVKIGMADTCTSLDDRYRSLLTHKVDEAFAATWNDEVNISVGMQQGTRCFVGGRKESDGVFVDVKFTEH